MEVQDGLALRILREHIVHPLDLLIADLPAHVEHDEVNAADRDQIIMTAVVLIASAIPRVAAVTLLAEVSPEVGVVIIEVADIVVARQHAIRQACLIEHPVGRIGVFPFRDQMLIVDDVAVVEHVLDVHALAVCQHPVVDIQLILIVSIHILFRIALIIFVVILRVAFDHEGEVIILTRGIVFIGCRDACVLCCILRRRVALTILNHHADLAIREIVFQGDLCRELHRFAICFDLRIQLIPCAGMDIARIQESLGIVRRAAPVDLHRIAGFRRLAEGDVECLIGEAAAAGCVKYRVARSGCLCHAFRHLDAAIIQRVPFTFLEGHIHDIFGRIVDRDREGRVAGDGRVCARLHDFCIGIFTRGRERDRLCSGIASLIRSSEHERMRAWLKRGGRDRIRQRDDLPIQHRLQRHMLADGILCGSLDAGIADLRALFDIGRDLRRGIVYRDRGGCRCAGNGMRAIRQRSGIQHIAQGVE